MRHIFMPHFLFFVSMAPFLHPQDASTISPFPRGQAMAEAFTIFSEEIEAIHYNPALSMYGRPQAASFSFSSWVEGTTLLALGWRGRILPNLAVGVLTTLFIADGIENTTGGASPFVLNNLGVWVPVLGSSASFIEFNATGNVSTVLHAGPLVIPLGANLKLGRYAYNGEGKTRLTSDLGTALLVHESFQLPSAVKNPLVRGLIPNRFAMTLKGLGVEIGSTADLATEFNTLDFTAAISFHHWDTGMFNPRPPFRWSIESELDLNTRRGFSWGLLNRFAFGEVKPELGLGLAVNGAEVRPSGGLRVAFQIKNIQYHFDYAFQVMGGLGASHHLAVGADIDADFSDPKVPPRLPGSDLHIREQTTEVRLLLRDGRLALARETLDSLLKKYPAHPEVLELKAWFDQETRSLPKP